MAAPRKIEEVGDTIFEDIENGLSKKLAAQKAGISARSIHFWLAKGEEDFNSGIESLESSFFHKFREAEGRLAGVCCDVILDRMPDNPSDAWIHLRRLDPEGYNPKRMGKFALQGETSAEKITCLFSLVADGTLPSDDAAKLAGIIQKQEDLSQYAVLSKQLEEMAARINNLGQVSFAGSINEDS